MFIIFYFHHLYYLLFGYNKRELVAMPQVYLNFGLFIHFCFTLFLFLAALLIWLNVKNGAIQLTHIQYLNTSNIPATHESNR